MKKLNFTSLLGILTMLFLAFSFTSCSSDDDDNGSDSSSSVSSQLAGTSWFGSNSDGTILMSLKLYASGTADLKMFGASSIERSSVPWTYHANNQTLFLKTNPSENKGWRLRVLSFTGSTMQITFPFTKGEMTFNMERSDGSSGGSSGDYDEPVAIVVHAIVYYKATQRYASKGTETHYLKTVGNDLCLYRNSSCRDLLGAVEYNHDRSRGGYDVSSYTYRVIYPNLEYTYYYYFN